MQVRYEEYTQWLYYAAHGRTKGGAFLAEAHLIPMGSPISSISRFLYQYRLDIRWEILVQRRRNVVFLLYLWRPPLCIIHTHASPWDFEILPSWLISLDEVFSIGKSWTSRAASWNEGWGPGALHACVLCLYVHELVHRCPGSLQYRSRCTTHVGPRSGPLPARICAAFLILLLPVLVVAAFEPHDDFSIWPPPRICERERR